MVNEKADVIIYFQDILLYARYIPYGEVSEALLIGSMPLGVWCLVVEHEDMETKARCNAKGDLESSKYENVLNDVWKDVCRRENTRGMNACFILEPSVAKSVLSSTCLIIHPGNNWVQ